MASYEKVRENVPYLKECDYVWMLDANNVSAGLWMNTMTADEEARTVCQMGLLACCHALTNGEGMEAT